VARPDHTEERHTPEMAEMQLAGGETEIVERHVLTLDDPIYGQLNGRNYLGYCDDCPAAGRGDYCVGPCPSR